METLTDLSHPNLSDSVTSALREMILMGRFHPGEAINEVQLSAGLRISRTPLREALFRLIAEGMITSRPRRGFFVRDLSVEEFEQIYPIRALLDPEALRLAGVPSKKHIEKMDALNRKLCAAREPAKLLQAEDEWHLELLADCPNRVLVGLIEHFMIRTRRYELALMRERRNVERSTDDHAVIISELRKGALGAACAALRRNMQSGAGPILKWLREREPGTPIRGGGEA